MTHEEWIGKVFDRAKATAIEALQRRKYQEVSLTVDIRGENAFEARMPDGEKLRPTRP